MTTTGAILDRPVLQYGVPGADSVRFLTRQMLGLALPVWAEQVLHMGVGLNDTYLANHLPTNAAAAGAAVGTITYFIWFIGLLVGTVGTGAAALIARAKGARHRRLANRVTGQAMAAAAMFGVLFGILLLAGATPIIAATQLQGAAHGLAKSYLRMLSVSLPFTMLMFTANAVLRGGGDTLWPMLVMMAVDTINLLSSFALCRGWWGLPVMGFDGIALGTILAYVSGGVIQCVVLLRVSRAVRLHLHRLWPHAETLRRLFRIGVPAGVEGLLAWSANFGVIAIINRADATNVMSAAHINTVRIEGISYLSGMAFATAAATMVGMSLGMKDARRAVRSAYLAYAGGGAVMALCGLLMITWGRYPAAWLSPADPHLVSLTTQCLMVTGFVQPFFAATMIFAGALRGAGDTFVVMVLNLASVLGLRFTGVIVVGLWLRWGLVAIWMVLAGELIVRGTLSYLRFLQGGWQQLDV